MTSKKASLLSIQMIVFAFIASMIGIGYLLKDPLIASFQNNTPLNALISLSFIVGLALGFITLWRLSHDMAWVQKLSTDDYNIEDKPHYLTKLSGWRIRNSDMDLAVLLPTDRQDILQDTEARLMASRESTRYLIGLLIFLGLLGTFWGLSITIRSVAGVIANMSSAGAEGLTAFNILKDGLKEPLSGMGTAFSCSMFGLAGSLILGFLDLQLGRAQSKIYFATEQTISHFEKPEPSFLSSFMNVSPTHPDYLIKILEFMAENIEQMNTQDKTHLERTSALERRFEALVSTLNDLASALKAQQQLKHSEPERMVAIFDKIFSGFSETISTLSKEQKDRDERFFDELKKELRLLGKILHPVSTQKTSTATIKAV
ncbi:MAG: hypothetical protein J0G29_03655 [Alphaproteobacteria bacterium]|nr:hypothetical protein [Alphaproteobacteria bacterium]